MQGATQAQEPVGMIPSIMPASRCSLGWEAAAHTIEAGDLAIMSVPAKLATAARCLLGRSAVMGKYAASPSSSPLIETHVARHTPMVMYVTCTMQL